MRNEFWNNALPAFLLISILLSACREEPPLQPPPPPAPPDTTTHEVVWTEYVFPRAGGMLEDVWAFSSDCAIAIGTVVEPHDPDKPPNAYVWDGVSWSPRALPIQWNSGDTTTIDWKYSAWNVNGI